MFSTISNAICVPFRARHCPISTNLDWKRREKCGIVKEKEVKYMINVDQLMEQLPQGYEQACYEKKAIERNRKIKNAKDLMKLCLLYLTQNCS